ncbi:TSP1 [Seminavis robusta]|uniref:TSP1 n=1 Tax=Seminavis robusta TaxID=568900 RepID=A0A9N8HVG5_9STRA|nr:TSP1 [Seminavis robusta]|eukprot:Sro1982_g309210.1 TSP1 (723) ;mRNA; r:11385-13553
MEVHVDTKLPYIKVEEEEDVSPPVTTSASFGTTSTTRTPSVARRRVSTCNDDVHALLNLDPASVAIRASMMGTNTLTLVANFAANLTHYVNLVQEGKKQDQHPGRPSVVISPSSNHCRPANSNNNNNQNNNNMDLDVYAEGFSDYVNQCVDQGPPTRTATHIMNHEAATHPNPNGNDPTDLTNHNSNNATQESTTMAAGTAATGTTGTTRRLCQDEATQTNIPNKRPRISTDHPSVDTASEPPASVEDSTSADDTSEISNMAENKDNHFSDSSTEGTPLVAATTEPNNMTEHSNDDSTDRSVENTAPTNTETITNMTDQQPVTVSTPPGTEETSTNTTPANTETTNTTDQQSGAASEPPETEENCTNITPANTDTTNMTHQQSDTASTPPDEEETSTNTDSTSETTNMAEHKDIHFSDSSTEGPPLAAATTEPNTMMEHSDVDSTDISVENTAANTGTSHTTDHQSDTATGSTPPDTEENTDSALESTNVVENNNKDDSLDCTMALAAPTTTISSFTAAEEDHHYINNKENHQPETTSSTIRSSSTLVIHDTDGPDDYNGKLEQSQVPRSVGLTRTILNQHLESLGLTTQFGMAVLSKNGSRVSHITLNQKWNQCPYSSQHLLKWWLGKGKQRLRTASILDPAKSDNANKEVPIFFATPPKLGGAPCHYVGHYQCVSFEANLDVKFKGEERQALLQFQFVRFDEAMAGKLANIAANRLSKKE